MALAAAASAPPPANAQDGLPQFRDPALRRVRPDLGPRQVVRFLTSADWPPFQFLAPDGSPTGFNADLARALCEELGLSCTLQAQPWQDLVPALQKGQADAVIAGFRPNADLEQQVLLTQVYFRLPARFAVRRDSPLGDAVPESLAGKSIAVVSGSAHEAYLNAFFRRSTVEAFPDEAAALAALQAGHADALFGDGVTLARWVGGAASGGCCRLAGGPYLESRFFGEGMAIAVPLADVRLRAALDYALSDIEAKGTMAELYLRWFPVGLFDRGTAQPVDATKRAP
ncbi:MAG TPA: transporter substrate-binding domain-containing protein [Hyphomicrobiales bacterium]|nr:transporter substrate-binding domain-containing protein [Hyphomicrobiales bacterium]